MKKLMFVAIIALMGTTAFAGNAHLFDIDEDQIVAELAELTSLENFVSSNEGVTLSMLNQDSELSAGFNLSALDALSSLNMFEPPLGIPSFLWGFCLGWVGILITYLVSDSKDETKKALLGCIISTAVYLIIWIIIVVAAASTATAVMI